MIWHDRTVKGTREVGQMKGIQTNGLNIDCNNPLPSPLIHPHPYIPSRDVTPSPDSNTFNPSHFIHRVSLPGNNATPGGNDSN